MLKDRDDTEYIQCSQCGHVHQTKQKHKTEDLYVDCDCPRCGAKRGLYIGADLNDFYELADVTLDRRYYEYKKF